VKLSFGGFLITFFLLVEFSSSSFSPEEPKRVVFISQFLQTHPYMKTTLRREPEEKIIKLIAFDMLLCVQSLLFFSDILSFFLSLVRLRVLENIRNRPVPRKSKENNERTKKNFIFHNEEKVRNEKL
jgi:hypothetical protein